MIEETLRHLDALVGFDTQNPPRTPDLGIFDYIRAQLPDFSFSVTDHGHGSVSLHGRRGAPRILFNVHLDTVPVAAGYTANPHALRVTETRAIGLGACDIKGSAAALITAARQAKGDAAFLFTTDEEAGQSTCVRRFCDGPKEYDLVIVGEPTQGRAVLEHRGILTARADFVGISGHASSGRADTDSAVHHAIDWTHAVLQEFRSSHALTYKNLNGLRYTIGRIEGGVKPNMIASDATILLGFRPLPGMDAHAYLAKLAQAEPAPANCTPGFYGPPLPAPGHPTADDHVDALGLPKGAPVDFWTEASLFSEAGYHALVFGPGDIAQAHTADEWVSLDDLASVTKQYTRILSR